MRSSSFATCRLFIATLLLCSGMAWAQDAATVKVGNQTKRSSGMVTSLEPGDVACYMSLKDEKGVRFDELAVFEICEQKIVGKRVALSYEIGSVLADECGGNPDCKKTRRVALVKKAQLINAKAGAAPSPALPPKGATTGKQ